MSQEATNVKDTLSYDEAVAFLPEGESVHCFMNPCGMLLGADWDRDDVLDALRGAREIRITGDTAQSMKHGIACENRGKMVFFETARRTDDGGSNVE